MNQPSLERGADDQTFHDVIEAYCGALSYAPGETATDRAEAYLQAVHRSLTKEGLSFCAGLAPLEGPLAPALAQAEEALRQAKARGPGQLCWGDGVR